MHSTQFNGPFANSDKEPPQRVDNLLWFDQNTLSFKRWDETNEQWIQVTTPMTAEMSFDSTAFLDASHQVNTTLKVMGVDRFNTTLGIPLWPAGTNPTDDWLDAGGISKVTPV